MGYNYGQNNNNNKKQKGKTMAKKESNISKEVRDLMNDGMDLSLLPAHIEMMYNARQNLMLWGDPGIGKTAMVEQFVRNMQKKNPNFGYHYYPLASKEPADLIGVPATRLVRDNSGQEILRTYWAIPNDLPTEEDWEGVMFFDEFNNAAPAMQNAMQQLIQERRLGDYKLPKGAFIIAAGNPSNVNAYTTEMQAPVKDRFAHKYVYTTIETWKNYMLGLVSGLLDKGDKARSEVYEQATRLIVQFVHQYQMEVLFDSDAMESGSYTFATPRSWDRIRDAWAANPGISDSQLTHLLSQYVGGAKALLFMEFKNDVNKYQNPNEILIEGKPFRDSDFNGMYGTFIGILSILTAELRKLPEDTSKLSPEQKKPLTKMIDNLISATEKVKVTGFKVAEMKTLLREPRFMPFLSVQAIAAVGKEAKMKTND